MSHADPKKRGRNTYFAAATNPDNDLSAVSTIPEARERQHCARPGHEKASVDECRLRTRYFRGGFSFWGISGWNGEASPVSCGKRTGGREGGGGDGRPLAMKDFFKESLFLACSLGYHTGSHLEEGALL